MNTRIQLQEAFKFALSMVLMYWLALWMDWDLVHYGPLAILLISLSSAGASLNKGLMRVIGTVIACLVGFAFLDWFGQERWLMMVALAGYLIFTGYFMQASRYAYAWYVAGFVPLVIWGDTYMDIDNAFHFGIFRLLETSVGVLIYSIVSVVLWPRFAGDELYRQGSLFLQSYRKLFGLYSGALRLQAEPDETAALRLRLDALLPQIQGTLQAAYGDSLAVRGQKRVWARIPVQFHTLLDALELWRLSIDDCRSLSLDQSFVGLDHSLSILDQRFERIDELWQVGQVPSAIPKCDDARLMLEVPADLGKIDGFSYAQRGMLLNYAHQFHTLDRASRELLTTLRVLVGIDSTRALAPLTPDHKGNKPPRWNPQHFTKALIPALAFIFGYLFWILPTDPPPGGQSVATQSGTLGLLSILSPVNMRNLVLMLIACLFVVVAPVYLVVMPWLDTGAGLLFLIFVYSMFFCYLGYRWPAIKLAALLLFVVTVNISNQQTYSFIGLVNLGFVLLIGGSSVIIATMLLIPTRPEKILVRGIQRFFRGCARISGGYAQILIGSRRRHYKNGYATVVQSGPGQLRAIEKSLDYRLLPEKSQEKMHHLLDTLHSVVYRLFVTRKLLDGFASATVPSAGKTPSPLGTALPRELQNLFEHWAKETRVSIASEQQRIKVHKLDHELEQLLKAYATNTEAQPDERMLVNLTALLGSVRGLLDAMEEIDQAVYAINWNRFVVARF